MIFHRLTIRLWHGFFGCKVCTVAIFKTISAKSSQFLWRFCCQIFGFFFPFSLSGGQKKKRISGIVLDVHHLIFHLVIDDSYF